METKIYQNLVI